jgi:hypothetical protein
MIGEHGRELAAALGIETLERLRGAPVQGAATRPHQGGARHILGERMLEDEHGLAALATLVEELEASQLGQSGRKSRATGIPRILQRLKESQRELPPKDRTRL